MDILKGVIERIVFENEENGFTIARLDSPTYDEFVTIVGNIASVNAGESVLLQGFWVNNPTYGQQFKIEKYETVLPATVVGLRKYLGSGMIRGIGPVMANRIVDKFGLETLDVIEKSPDQLSKVQGIGSARVSMVKEAWEAQREIKNVMIFLQAHNVSTSHATKIYKTYRNDSIELVQENPYRLASEIYGIGFKTADTIAQKLGVEKNAPNRVKAGLKYVLSQEADNSGHVFLYRQELIEVCQEILELSPDDIDLGIASLIAEEAIIIERIGDDEAIYLAPFYYCEVGINNTLNETLSTNRSLLTDQFISQAINQIESKLSIHLAMGQQQAIHTAANAKAMILTGGPGTGKTTTTIGMICLFEMLGQKVILAAPTGRAAKRLSEMTQREAKTIHRLLEFSPQGMGFKRNRENPLEADVVIVDEMSMVDLVLMNNLIKAIPLAAVIILIGDVDQLPSVGAGNVLKDLINCGRIKVVELTEIFRQAQESMIITNAHRINSGKFPQLSGLDDRNFFFIEEEDPDLAAEKICGLVKDRLPTHYNYHPMDDIQVLCPMRRSSVGSENLNILLQNALNGDDSNQIGTRSGFRINDKVMQIRNNYDLDVFNGDIGRITNFSRIDKIVEVTFPEKTVNYDMLDLSELVLSYATTIHKSQGSEYTAVVIPLMTQHYIMLQRNLVYTGITRAKKLVVIVGTKQAMTLAIRNNKVVQRNTNLATRLSVTDENLELKLGYEELLIDDLYMNSGSNFLPPSSADQA